MVEKALVFIKENLNLIKEDKFEDLYKILQGCHKYSTISVGEVTNIFLDCDINPLNYMSYVPMDFLRNINCLKGKFVIPNNGNIQQIHNGAFCNCGFLTHLDIPEGVEYLDLNSIVSCINLKSISLPSTLHSIGANVFSLCPIAHIEFNGTVEEWQKVNLNKGCFYKIKTSKVFCLDGKTNLRHQ